MGFSILSVLEFVYFVTIRLFCSYYRKVRQNGELEESHKVRVHPQVNIMITKSRDRDMPTPNISTSVSGYWVHKRNLINAQQQQKNDILRVVRGIGGDRRRSGPRFVW